VGVDGVLRVQSGRTSVQLSAYHNRVNDYIAITPRGDTLTDEGLVPLAYYEQSDATLHGVEGQVEAQVTEELVLGAMGDMVRGRFTDDRPLPFMPAARLGASVRWEAKRWSVGGDVRHAFAQDDVALGEYATESYTLLNLSASYTLALRSAAHTFTLRADNVGDVAYRDATSRIKAFAPNPGRNVSLVYRVLF
jgi:iron complex outermembrane receptor protein